MDDSGNWSQPTATVYTSLSRVGRRRVCQGLLPVANRPERVEAVREGGLEARLSLALSRIVARDSGCRAEGEGFEPSSDPEARNGFRDLFHFAQPCALRPGARHNARQFRSDGPRSRPVGPGSLGAAPNAHRLRGARAGLAPLPRGAGQPGRPGSAATLRRVRRPQRTGAQLRRGPRGRARAQGAALPRGSMPPFHGSLPRDTNKDRMYALLGVQEPASGLKLRGALPDVLTLTLG
jgi:hypothetical protein